jgi:GNAT superfamily N-acetyltransferase
MYFGAKQVGFARMVTGNATFAYLADVFLLESHRRKGLSKWLKEFIAGHEELQRFRRFLLATKEAHGFYAQFGFEVLANLSLIMESLKPDVYRQVI